MGFLNWLKGTPTPRDIATGLATGRNTVVEQQALQDALNDLVAGKITDAQFKQATGVKAPDLSSGDEGGR